MSLNSYAVIELFLNNSANANSFLKQKLQLKLEPI